MSEQQQVTVTVDLEDGSTLECVALAIFHVNEKEYVAMMEKEEIGKADAELLFYHYSESADGSPIFSAITDDTEYEKAENVFRGHIESGAFQFK